MRSPIDSRGFVHSFFFFFERGYVANLILELSNSSVIILVVYLTEKESKGEMVNVFCFFFPKVS